MIYLAYIGMEQTLYALYGEVRVKCHNNPWWQFNTDILNLAMATIPAEQQQAHFWPEHRGICWDKKIPFTQQVWCDFLDHGTVLD